jgi:death-on-curing protein
MNEEWTPTTVERLDELMAALRPDEQPSGRRPRQGCVEGAIGNAVLAASYAQETDEPDILHVAAYLMRSLARDHCYVDGNKRIAWMATLDVLAVHAATTLDVDQDEAAGTVEAVATGTMDVPALITWLADHLVPLT